MPEHGSGGPVSEAHHPMVDRLLCRTALCCLGDHHHVGSWTALRTLLLRVLKVVLIHTDKPVPVETIIFKENEISNLDEDALKLKFFFKKQPTLA